MVVPEHIHQWFLFGVFFLGLGAFELAWAVALIVSPSRFILSVGLVASAATIALWAVSRTVGMPIGPEPGRAGGRP